MRKFVKNIICVMLLLGMLSGMAEQNVQAETQSTYMTLRATVKSMTKIHLSWKAKNVTQYKLYRCVQKKGAANDGYQMYELIAKLDGKKTYYTDKGLKKNRFYTYRIVGYRNGKQKFHGNADEYTGLWCCFDEYQVSDCERSPQVIELKLYASYGMKPDGYRIYRKKEGAKKFKCIKNWKKKASGLTYRDKAVAAGQIYYYKARAYRTIGKKKYYSSYSETVEMSATNQTGVFRILPDEMQSSAEEEAVFQIISDAGNGELTLPYASADLKLEDKEGTELTDSESFVRITEYSKDGKSWIAYKAGENAPVLRQKETLWIRVRSNRKEKINTLKGLSVFQMSFEVRYNHLSCILDMDPVAQTAKAAVFAEAYH